MAVQQLQKLSCRPVVGHGVRNRSQAVQSVVPIRIGGEVPPEVPLRLLRVLLLVQAIRRALPDVDFNARDRGARSRILDDPMHIDHFPIIWLLQDDTRVVGGWWRIFPEKRTEDSALRDFIRGSDKRFLGDLVDQPAESMVSRGR